jgi:hypothetical protein
LIEDVLAQGKLLRGYLLTRRSLQILDKMSSLFQLKIIPNLPVVRVEFVSKENGVGPERTTLVRHRIRCPL